MGRGILDELREMLESEGLQPGTDVYEKRLLFLRVDRCKMLHGVGDCKDCTYYEECPLVREFSYLQRYRQLQPK